MAEICLSKQKRRMEKFTEDLVTQILVNLPVKSLLRFKSVCRSWFDLIKSPNFVHKHLNHHKGNDNILMFSRRELSNSPRYENVISFHSYESLDVILPSLDIPHNLSMLCFQDDTDGLIAPDYRDVGFCGPCDGLICFSSRKNDFLIVCNPAMREFKLLPPYTLSGVDGWECLPASIGLGFDSLMNDYKIVVIVTVVRKEEEEEAEEYFGKVMVYNLGTNSWREIEHGTLNWTVYFEYLEYYGTLFNGTLHWISQYDNETALTFDMNTEVVSRLEIPYVGRGNEYMKDFVVLNGSLAMFICEITSVDEIYSIWVMHIYGDAESWTRQLVIGPLTTLIRWPLLLWKNEALLVENNHSQLVFVSLGTNEQTIFNFESVVNAIVYQESLISIK